LPEIIGEYIDRLCTIEMRPGTGNLPRGQIHLLYDAARREAKRPLSLAMAEALVARLDSSETVFLLTGAGGPPPWPRGEVDGLLGAAALARVFALLLRSRVVLLTEARTEGPIRAVCRAAGLTWSEPMEQSRLGAVSFEAMPLEADACREQAPELLDSYRPAAIVAVEKLSPNRKGVIHGSTGFNYDDIHTKPQFLLREAEARGILTAGIGDGGNEIGFGRISKEVDEIIPAGRVCQCPCAGGATAALAADHLLVAAISNWGAYGLAAMIGYLLDAPTAQLLGADDVDRMLRACVDAGAFDGASARPVLADDGVPLQTHRDFVVMLESIVTIGHAKLASPGH
jgi:hypothetical protein